MRARAPRAFRTPNRSGPRGGKRRSCGLTCPVAMDRGHRLRLGVNTSLLDERPHVGAHGAGLDAEPGCDLRVAEARAKQPEDLTLATGQLDMAVGLTINSRLVVLPRQRGHGDEQLAIGELLDGADEL